MRPIDADRLMEIIRPMCGKFTYNGFMIDYQRVMSMIDSAPTIDALSEWVPCSERLPSEDGYYLCCNKRYLPYVGHFLNGQWNDFDGTIVHADAWMPLPKPYREREGE